MARVNKVSVKPCRPLIPKKYKTESLPYVLAYHLNSFYFYLLAFIKEAFCSGKLTGANGQKTRRVFIAEKRSLFRGDQFDRKTKRRCDHRYIFRICLTNRFIHSCDVRFAPKGWVGLRCIFRAQRNISFVCFRCVHREKLGNALSFFLILRRRAKLGRAMVSIIKVTSYTNQRNWLKIKSSVFYSNIQIWKLTPLQESRFITIQL